VTKSTARLGLSQIDDISNNAQQILISNLKPEDQIITTLSEAEDLETL